MSKSITIYDIAKEVGLSHTTVSQALRGLPSVKEETRVRVQEAAHRLGYRRNNFASSLRMGASRQIALVPYSGSQSKLANLFDALQKMLDHEGYSLIQYPHLTMDNAQHIFAQILQGGYDGLITYLYSYQQLKPFVAAFRERRCPVVVIGRPTDMEHKSGVITFDMANLASLQEAMQTLHNLGHRRIVHILTRRTVGSAQNLLIQEFVKAHGPAGWRSNFLLEKGWQPGLEEGRRTAERLLAERPGVTAVQCPNDYFAMGLIRGLQDLGVEVPRELSVIGSDNQDFCEYMVPRLSSIEVGEYSAAPQIVASLMEHLRQPEWSSLANRFELHSVFHRRASIGPALA